MKVAIEGCAHGDLDRIYETLAYAEKVGQCKVDLLLICGDFQAVRNGGDLQCLACPPKYRDIKDFYKYYNGEKKAPVLTIFIGGNHEASNHLLELYHGGWVAPNIYYMGCAGVVRYGGLRIGGLSGIFKRGDYRKGHYERVPFDSTTIRTVYHIKEFDVWKLLQIRTPMDIFMSHDWPQGIAFHGAKEELFRKKPFLKQEVESNTLGSDPAWQLLQCLKPRYWFAAHLHVKFSAIVKHTDMPYDEVSQRHSGSNSGQPLAHDQVTKKTKLDIGDSTTEDGAQQPSPQPPANCTKFLSLSKCLPGQDFLQIVDIPSQPPPYQLQYDEEWLAILRLADPYFSLSLRQSAYPARLSEEEIQSEQETVRTLLTTMNIKDNFEVTSPSHNPAQPNIRHPVSARAHPQTVELIGKLRLSNVTLGMVNEVSDDRRRESLNPNEIDIDGIGDVFEEDECCSDLESRLDHAALSTVEASPSSPLTSSIPNTPLQHSAMNTDSPRPTPVRCAMVLPPPKQSGVEVKILQESDEENKNASHGALENEEQAQESTAEVTAKPELDM